MPENQISWYFVYRLLPFDDHYLAGYRYEVQILDDEGRATHVGYFVDPEKPLVIDKKVMPHKVLYAATRQQEGRGNYINDRGQTTDFMGHPIEEP